jgi:hypothetical protein
LRIEVTEQAQGLLSNKRLFIRSLIARTVLGAGATDESIEAFCFRTWPWASPGSIAKSAISAMMSEGNKVADDLLTAVRERTVLGRLPFRRVKFNVRLLAQTQGAIGYWVSQARPKPLSKPVLAGSILEPLKSAAIIVQTSECLKDSSNITEIGLGVDLEKAVAASIDLALLDPNNAGIPEQTPASITYGAPSIASSGSDFNALKADLSAMISAYSGNIETAAWIMAPMTAVQISLLGGPAAMIDLSVSGGTLVGLPAITTAALGIDSNGPSICLVDTQAVSYGLENLTIETSDQTALLMSDDPESIPGELVSLWQTGSVAWKAESLANWQLQRDNAVILLTGADYS